jgi:peptidoglycan-N-acetylglucosamine deacetylase
MISVIMRASFISILPLVIAVLTLPGCNKDELPMGEMEPGIALTFDDNYFSEWADILPVFNKYDAHGTFFICPYNGLFGTDLEKLHQLSESGNEIGLHTVNHPDLKEYLSNHSLIEYLDNEIIPGIAYLDSIGVPVTSFAYPYGTHTKAANNALAGYFSKIRCIGKLSYGDQQSYILNHAATIVYGAFMEKPSHTSLQDIRQALLAAKSHNAVLVIIGHKPVQDSSGSWTFTVQLLDSICSFARQEHMKFYRFCDL